MNIQITTYTDDMFDKYVTFSRKAWGNSSYQACQNYLVWLYHENPNISGYNNFLIAQSPHNNEVIGVCHSLWLPWTVEGRRIMIPTLHNLHVDEEYRKGVGVLLLYESFAASEHAFISGASDQAVKLYEALKSQKIYLVQYRKILKPISGVTFYIRQKIKSTPIKFKDISKEFTYKTAQITSSPSPAICEKIAFSLMKKYTKNTQGPLWTADIIKWRFFHEIAPKHYLIYIKHADEFSFAIVSLGVRKNLILARLIEISCERDETIYQLLPIIECFLKKMGAHVFLINSYDSKFCQQLTDMKWNKLKESPGAFFVHQDKGIFSSLMLSAAAGDYGFESID